MQRITVLAILAITLFISPAFAQKPMKPMKVKLPNVSMSIDNKTTVVVNGMGNSTTVGISADNSQNLSYTIVDARQDHRQWHDSHDDYRQYHQTTTTTSVDSRQMHYREGDVTYAPRYREGNVTTVQPYCAPRAAAAQPCPPTQRLTVVQVGNCQKVKLCVKVSDCGRSFTTTISGSNLLFKVKDDQPSLPYKVRGQWITMEGNLWTDVRGVPMFTSACSDGTIRTFIDP